MSDSTSSKAKGKPKGKPAKPGKPYEGFPMHAHASGQWAKKIRGKLYYFGVWADPDAALERLNHELPHLKDGRTPPPADALAGCTLRHLCNEFLAVQEDKVSTRELSPRSFQDYYKTCEMLIKQFGKDRMVDDIKSASFQKFRTKLARKYSVVSLRNMITRCRTVFIFAFNHELIDKPVTYGASFDKPSAKSIRRSRNEGGGKIFTREEALKILDYLEGKHVAVPGESKKVAAKPDPVMHAMVLLGLNCGFGNTDCASLPQKAVDLEGGWIDFPRPKTEIPRRIPLWPETTAALEEAIKIRPRARNATDGRLCFLTAKQRHPWVRVKQKVATREEANGNPQPSYVPIDGISPQFKKVLNRLKINGRRGLGFYCFRHCFETHAGESRDQIAIDAVMGHVDPSMGASYRHGVSDDRLRAVVGAVHDWLFGKPKA